MKQRKQNSHSSVICQLLHVKCFSGGFSLVEMLLYVAILAVTSIIIVNTLILLMTSFASVKISKTLGISASTGLERIVREVRNSESIDFAESTLNSNPGVLKLNVEGADGVPYTALFYIENGVLKVKKNSGPGQALTLLNATPVSLVFRRITTLQGEAVRVELTLSATERNITRTENFYASAILRGSYGN
jgi:hypothetical protein